MKLILNDNESIYLSEVLDNTRIVGEDAIVHSGIRSKMKLEFARLQKMSKRTSKKKEKK